MSVVPLHSAVAGRHDEVVRLLVESGADVNARQQGGWTAIHAAAQHGDEATADLLLANGADPNPCTEDGATAADLAEAAGYAELAERLRTAAPGR
jgi:ankyrin repeat protein